MRLYKNSQRLNDFSVCRPVILFGPTELFPFPPSGALSANRLPVWDHLWPLIGKRGLALPRRFICQSCHPHPITSHRERFSRGKGGLGRGGCENSGGAEPGSSTGPCCKTGCDGVRHRRPWLRSKPFSLLLVLLFLMKEDDLTQIDGTGRMRHPPRRLFSAMLDAWVLFSPSFPPPPCPSPSPHE